MKVTKESITIKTLLVVGIFILFELAGFLLLVLLQQQPQKEYAYNLLSIEELHAQGKDVSDHLNDNLESYLAYYDVDGIINITQQAFENNLIDAFDCHTLAHTIGHHAVMSDHLEHLDSHITADTINFCGGGFMHGVESGFADQYDHDYPSKLYTFCKKVLPIATIYKGCYHGAGHTFMHNTDDYKKALALCDTLVTDSTVSPEFCYRGVFSEQLDRFHASGKENRELIGFCATVSEEMQTLCGYELNGFGLNTTSSDVAIEQAFRDCYENSHNIALKIACIHSVSWITVDNLLARQKDIVAFPFLIELPQQLREAYITATIHELKRHIHDGSSPDWNTFCESISVSHETDTCDDYFTRSQI